MRGRIANSGWVIAACLAAAALIGCSGPAGTTSIVIGPDRALTDSATVPTILVDVIGLTERERLEWDAMPVSSYWSPASPRRKAAAERSVRIRIAGENRGAVTIGPDHPIRAAWKRAGARWAYVIANLPGGIDDKPGVEDPRRLAVSLAPGAWDEGAEIVIEVRRDSVVCRTPPPVK